MRSNVHRFTIAILLTASLACSPRRVAELAVLSADVRRSTEIAYGDDERQRLDVYRPRDNLRPAPVIVFVYGGRWKYGSKRDYLLLASALVRRGWVVVIPDVRRYPALFPSFIEDGASVVRWAIDNIGRFGGDTARVFVVGHSSGGHTAAMLALDESYLLKADVPARTVRGFVSMSGPVDTVWTARDVQRLMGPAERWPSTYPATHIDGTEAPLLLLHGSRDDVVTVGNSIRLAAKIRERGGCARLVVYEGIDHVQIAVGLAFPSLGLGTAQYDLARFIQDPTATCPGP
jgi:acetyl esterase/lipase